MSDQPILNPRPGLKPNLEDELHLRVHADTKVLALMQIHEYLTKEYGFFFNLQVLEPLGLEDHGVWGTKLRAGRNKMFD